MTGTWATKAQVGKSKCSRCGRLFTPKEPDQRFGPVCVRKNQNNRIEVLNKKGELVAVIV